MQHDGKPFCHKPCYAALFGPKGALSHHSVKKEISHLKNKQTKSCIVFYIAGVNIGGAGSYVYDNPTSNAPAAGSLETEGKPQEEAKKVSTRGPVKGETSAMQKHKTDETCRT